MAQNSKIEWTHHTANLWWGCTEVHAGCDHCYAKALSHRWGNDLWGIDKPRKIIRSTFDDLDKYQRLAAEAGEIHLVFIGSMMDIFEKSMPVIDSKGRKMYCKLCEGGAALMVHHATTNGFQLPLMTEYIRERLFARINLGLYPNLMLLLLTKRPSNINKMTPKSWKTNPPRNVMFGTSLSEQSNENLVDQLLQVHGRHFLSIEPQIEYIKLKNKWFLCTEGDTNNNKVRWVIQGGESGGGKRLFDIVWARSMRDQCANLGVPYFFKQIDKVQPIPEDLLIRQFPIL